MLTILTETSDQSSLDVYVKNDAPLTVLYFTATWCGPCKAIAPTVQSLADKYQLDFKRKLIGKTVKVLIDKKINNSNSYFGRDEYMNSVITSELKNKNLIGKIVEVEIQKTNKQTMFGTIINNFKTEKEFAA